MSHISNYILIGCLHRNIGNYCHFLKNILQDFTFIFLVTDFRFVYVSTIENYEIK